MLGSTHQGNRRLFTAVCSLIISVIIALQSPLSVFAGIAVPWHCIDTGALYKEHNYITDYECCNTDSSKSTTASNPDNGWCGNKGDMDPANLQYIWNFLVNKFESKGYNQAEAESGAAAVIGNWQQESRVNPAVKGGLGCGHTAAVGIGQWCGDRITRLEKYAEDKHTPLDCLSTQLEYAWSDTELGSSDFAPLISAMKGKSPSQAALLFDNDKSSGVRGFEGSTDQENGNNIRESNASSIYSQFTGKTAPTGSLDAQCRANKSNSAAVDDGQCKDPFRDLKNSGPLRWDGGEDYGGNNGSGPVYAACPGVVTHLTTGTGGWGATPGLFLSYRVTSGKAQGKDIYIAEDCTPRVSVGDKVDSSTVICDYKQASFYLETGWSNGGGTYVDWSDYTAHCNSWASNSGQDFGKFLASIGGQDGHPDSPTCGVSTQGAPAGWGDWSVSNKA